MPSPEPRHTPIGPAGRNVAANIEQLRAARHLSLRRLADRLGSLGHPMLTSSVHAIVQCQRRVDADDLAALGDALGVSPGDLLLPPGDLDDVLAEDHPAVREARNLTKRIEELLQAPPDPDAARALSGYVDRALRRVSIEVEELLAETAMQPGNVREAKAS